MADHFASYESQWWPQGYPVIYSGQYSSLSSQDEHWSSMDISSNSLDQKIQPLHRSHSSLMADQQNTLYSPQHFSQTSDHNRSIRYVSPSESHHSSQYSESSASTEHVLTPSSMSQSILYPSTSSFFPVQHTFALHDVAMVNHTGWHADSYSSFSALHAQSDTSTYLPAQSSLPPRELEMAEHHDDHDLGLTFDSNLETIHSKSPLQRPHPEELELCDAHTESSQSTGNDSHNFSTPRAESPSNQPSDTDTMEDEDEEQVMIDNDSDSEYENRPNRRRASRTTPRAKHSRKSSNSLIVSPTSRVHKRTSSASTITSIATASSSRRSSSKTSKTKTKTKGPKFLTPAIPVSKSDRVYPCVFHNFGCLAEFPNKNEWKRHVACQHLQLGYYRCDLGSCDPDSVESSPPSHSSSSSTPRPGRHGRRSNSTIKKEARDEANPDEEIVKYYNDFNRKDLFTQHCRRMHGPSRNPALCSNNKGTLKKNSTPHPTKEDEVAFEIQLDEIRARCWHVRRRAPSRSTCGFCNTVFDKDYYNTASTTTTTPAKCAGQGNEASNGAEEKAWEERMEHVARHYEKEGRDRNEEELDEDLLDWGLETGVLRRLSDGRPWLVSVEDPTAESMDEVNGIATDEKNVSGIVKVEDDVKDDAMARRKARRQPSRTAVVLQQRRVSFKEEELDDEDALGDSD